MRAAAIAAAAALARVADAAGAVQILRGKSASFGRLDVESELAVEAASGAQHVVNSTVVDGGVVLAGAGARKPIRIARGGELMKTTPEPQARSGPSNLHCGITVKVHSGSDKGEVCPEECPFFAQDRNDKDFCTFACVAEAQCKTMNPLTPIGDVKLGVCRSCVVAGCQECDHSVTEDKCAMCQAGYLLRDDGLCYFKYAGEWMNIMKYIVIVILVVVVIWILDMQCRPCCNEQGLAHGLKLREKMKLHMPKNDEGERNQWPLFTNLMNTHVAGTGMMLHFNFQFALIVWAVFVALVWMCFAQFVDNSLWRLGTRRFGTPRNNCILVAWGYETQNALMWTKVSFLIIVYTGSVAMFMFYGISQLRTFQRTDYNNKTMKDFVAMVTGLPAIPGTKPVEDDLRARIESVTGKTVVGVSVAWDHGGREEEVAEALASDLASKASPDAPQPAPQMNALRNSFYKFERTIFGLPDAEPAEADVEADTAEAEKCRAMVESMYTSPRAFAVFPTQEDMEEAVSACSGGFSFEGKDGIILEEISAEPDTVQWGSFGHASNREKAVKLAAGFGIIALACALWGIVFYSPYAYYVMTFNYENGRQPGFEVGFAFSMIVVVGNAIMYEVCARISDWVGFRFKDNREACYMILYTVACMFNVGLDFITTYRTAELVMEGLGFRNYFGIPLKEITEFTAKFETYGMQRSLAENTYAYAFPSTYLIPFLIEPFPTILAPLWIGRLVVRSHPEVQGLDAEEWVGMAEMEMGRYADLLLNTILGILIFYFPGGYTWMLFLGMAGSHCWIYAFDHYRVLRSIPACTFASYDIEWWAQALMAPIIGIIAACLAFKSNCEPGVYCVKGFSIILICFCAWLVHTVVHICLLVFIVPKYGLPPPAEDPGAKETFERVARKNPSSWFTANPVHCLRSKHFYQHSPPCDHFVRGKEELMQANAAIGCFFDGSNPEGKSPKARSPKGR